MVAAALMPALDEYCALLRRDFVSFAQAVSAS
jgi:hypothetical protein